MTFILLGGMFVCRSGEIITGFQYSSYKTFSKLLFQPITTEAINKAYETVHLSNQLISIQEKYINQHQSSVNARKVAASMITNTDNPNTVRICLGIPMTSKGTKMKSVTESPIWTNLFDSFMKSIDWKSNRFVFAFYLGLDKYDDLYDTGDAWSELRTEFKTRATYRLKEQLLNNEEVDEVLTKKLLLKISHFDHLQGAPTQVVSQVMLEAYVDGYDYYYQVNDDTIIVTPNWAPKLIQALASNPSIPNLGVTGPLDTNNDKIFTHSFVHRTHLEVGKCTSDFILQLY